MPRYDYRCRDCEHLFEKTQSFNSVPGANCPECGAESDRQLSIPAVHYKGSGFYTTDHARTNVGRSGGKSEKEKESTAKKDDKSKSSSSSKKSDTKSEAKSTDSS